MVVDIIDSFSNRGGIGGGVWFGLFFILLGFSKSIALHLFRIVYSFTFRLGHALNSPMCTAPHVLPLQFCPHHVRAKRIASYIQYHMRNRQTEDSSRRIYRYIPDVHIICLLLWRNRVTSDNKRWTARTRNRR